MKRIKKACLLISALICIGLIAIFLYGKLQKKESWPADGVYFL